MSESNCSRSSLQHEVAARYLRLGRCEAELEAAGHDVLWTGDFAQDPGDEEILALANREERILFTLDKDFGELAIRLELPHHGIARLVNISARLHGKMCAEIVDRYGEELLRGAIVTVEATRVRIRPPEE